MNKMKKEKPIILHFQPHSTIKCVFCDNNLATAWFRSNPICQECWHKIKQDTIREKYQKGFLKDRMKGGNKDDKENIIKNKYKKRKR